jgi:hypothetical protein
LTLETQSKVMGWYVVAGWLSALVNGFLLQWPGDPARLAVVLALTLGPGIFLTRRWFRLRAYMRRAQYAARIGAAPRY